MASNGCVQTWHINIQKRDLIHDQKTINFESSVGLTSCSSSLDKFDNSFVDSSDGMKEKSGSALVVIDLTGDNSSDSNVCEKHCADFTGVEERKIVSVSDVEGISWNIFEYPWSDVARPGFSLDLQLTQNSVDF